MTKHDSILDAQVRSMLEYLRRYEVGQIEILLDESHSAAAKILRNAHRRARERMRKRFHRERRRMREAEQTAAARVATQKRLAKHDEVNRLIAAAWGLLPDALNERWADRHARSEWCDMLLEQAFRSLPGPAVLVEHPNNWERKERQAFLEKIHQHYGQLPEARPDAVLTAGLRLHSDCACLDGSIDGLLAQRRRIEADLLLHLGQAISDAPAAAEKKHA